MLERNKIIPEVVLRHKDNNARMLIFEKYFQRYRKSKLLCGACFLILGAVGAHRIYLGQYKVAAIVAGLFILLTFLKPMFFSMMSKPSDFFVSLIFFLPFIVLLVEFILLPMSYGKANEDIRQSLVEDIQLTPYVSLS